MNRGMSQLGESPNEMGMGMSEYTDEERMQIAKKEYKNYQVGDSVQINDNKTTVGYVAEVNHNDGNGEDSYVITDPQDPAKETFLYQRSQETADGC